MGEHNCRRHVFRSFVRGVSEHYSLVSGSLFGCFFPFCFAGVNALGYVWRLFCKEVGNKNFIGVENIVVVDVSYFPYRFADYFLVIEIRLCGDFSGYYNAIAFNKRFARNAAELVLLKACVENAVGNIVGYFVGVSFANRL